MEGGTALNKENTQILWIISRQEQSIPANSNKISTNRYLFSSEQEVLAAAIPMECFVM